MQLRLRPQDFANIIAHTHLIPRIPKPAFLYSQNGMHFFPRIGLSGSIMAEHCAFIIYPNAEGSAQPLDEGEVFPLPDEVETYSDGSAIVCLSVFLPDSIDTLMARFDEQLAKLILAVGDRWK